MPSGEGEAPPNTCHVPKALREPSVRTYSLGARHAWPVLMISTCNTNKNDVSL
jgi:hypothetical protein